MKSIIVATSAMPAVFGGDAFEPRAEFAVAEKQLPIGLAIPMDIGLGKAAPAHADHVEPDQMRQPATAPCPRG